MQWYMLLAYLAAAAVALGVWAAMVAWEESRPESQWRDWYENTDPTGWPGVSPQLSVCDAHRSSHWRMLADTKRMSDAYSQQVAAVWPNKLAVQAIGDTHLAIVEARVEQHKRQTGWSEAQYRMCSGFFAAERNPGDACGRYGRASVVSHPINYGEVGYCIEHGIPPFD